MPIYEYVCSKCGFAFEKLVPSSKSKPKCEKCGSPKLTRQFSTFAAHGGASGSLACRSADQCPAAVASGGGACASCCPHAQ
ncbi:MAG: zinc ribbon domain-containing protein [Planctomycetes bacterium]|nr:zinc ribbon domain-containing protein [Planctomycetota bacterium]